MSYYQKQPQAIADAVVMDTEALQLGELFGMPIHVRCCLCNHIVPQQCAGKKTLHTF